jgi:hypothetical protein
MFPRSCERVRVWSRQAVAAWLVAAVVTAGGVALAVVRDIAPAGAPAPVAFDDRR